MAIQKNFVVKNGIEVNDNLIFADRTANKVGIGTTVANQKLFVNGGIGATSLVLSGVGTIPTIVSTTGIITTLNSNTGSITTVRGTTLDYNTGYIVSGIVTTLSGNNLNYSGISTVGSLSIGATEVLSSARELKNIVSLDATTLTTIETAISSGPITFTDLLISGITTLGITGISTLNVTGVGTFASVDINAGELDVSRVDTSNLYVSGISTLSTVKISSGIITASSGIVTYYGDAQYLQNLPSATPGGSDTQVQYNNAGSFAGSSNFTFDGSSVVIGSGVTINSSGITVTGVVTTTDFNSNYVTITNSAIVGSGITINSTGINATAGIITASDFNSTSDLNLKENIVTVSNALEITNQLRGVRFEWKKDHKPSYGVIAQELEEILPELVSNTDPKTVNYNGIIGILIEAIKDQQNQINILKSKFEN